MATYGPVVQGATGFFSRCVVKMPDSAQEDLLERIEASYGLEFKGALARDLGVHRQTVRRLFLHREKIPKVYVLAIEFLLLERAS